MRVRGQAQSADTPRQEKRGVSKNGNDFPKPKKGKKVLRWQRNKNTFTEPIYLFLNSLVKYLRILNLKSEESRRDDATTDNDQGHGPKRSE